MKKSRIVRLLAVTVLFLIAFLPLGTAWAVPPVKTVTSSTIPMNRSGSVMASLSLAQATGR